MSEVSVISRGYVFRIVVVVVVVVDVICTLNGPFAANGHMVQSPPCWRASYPLGHPKQSDLFQSNLNFVCFGCPSA